MGYYEKVLPKNREFKFQVFFLRKIIDFLKRFSKKYIFQGPANLISFSKNIFSRIFQKFVFYYIFQGPTIFYKGFLWIFFYGYILRHNFFKGLILENKDIFKPSDQ